MARRLVPLVASSVLVAGVMLATIAVDAAVSDPAAATSNTFQGVATPVGP